MPHPPEWRDRGLALALLSLSLLVFWSAPVSYLADGEYTLLLAQNLLDGEGWRLDRHFPRPGAAGAPAGYLPYQVLEHRGHVYFGYPNASAYLALPLVAAVDLLGLSVLDRAGGYDAARERKLQRILAGLLGASLTAILYLGFRAIAPVWLSAAAALTATVASVVLSDLTRALWSQSWATLLVGVVTWELLVSRSGGRAPRCAVVGSALFWLVLVRPPAMLVALCVLGYLLVDARSAVRPTLAWLAAWTTSVAAINWFVYGSVWQPSIYLGAELFAFEGWPLRAWSVLASPSRGLFVYMPWVVLAGCAVVLAGRLAARGIVAMSLTAAAAYFVLLSLYVRWVGGACYGPRLWAEMVPLLALAATAGLQAALAAESRRRRAMVLALAVVTVGWSLFVNYRGAFAPETHAWNRRLEGQGWRSPAVYDWRQPQFLEGLLEPSGGEGSPKSYK